MHTVKTTPCSQRRRLATASIQIVSTTFIKDTMLGRCLRQLKMPRPDAYEQAANGSFVVRGLTRAGGAVNAAFAALYTEQKKAA